MLDPSSSDANTSTGSTAPPSSSRLAATSGAPRRARNQEDTSRTRGRATSASGRRLVLTEWREKRARPSVPANISSTPRYASPWTPISEATGPHARRSLAARGARCRGLRRVARGRGGCGGGACGGAPQPDGAAALAGGGAPQPDGAAALAGGGAPQPDRAWALSVAAAPGSAGPARSGAGTS